MTNPATLQALTRAADELRAAVPEFVANWGAAGQAPAVAQVCATYDDLRRKLAPPARPFVVIESPFAGEVERNVAYARAAVADSLRRGEAPFASHLLYTQPGILDDTIPAERSLGINAGLELGLRADLTAVYSDFGLSRGMQLGIEAAIAAGRPVEFRSLGAPWAET